MLELVTHASQLETEQVRFEQVVPTNVNPLTQLVQVPDPESQLKQLGAVLQG